MFHYLGYNFIFFETKIDGIKIVGQKIVNNITSLCFTQSPQQKDTTIKSFAIVNKKRFVSFSPCVPKQQRIVCQKITNFFCEEFCFIHKIATNYQTQHACHGATRCLRVMPAPPLSRVGLACLSFSVDFNVCLCLEFFYLLGDSFFS